MKIKCLAIDDEPYALKQIADYILKTPFLELSGRCGNAFEAMESMASEKIDLIFVDINMPEMSGMDFAKTLPPEVGVIFTTAYGQYAVESYKVNAIDYLLKPISYDDFLRAANKAQKYFSRGQGEQGGIAGSDHVFVNCDGKIVRVNLHEIDFIESSSEYVKINLNNRTQVVSLLRLKNLESILPADRFMRVHRSFIVNLRNITTIERNRIVFYGDTYIPVSDQYKAEFRKFVDSNFL
jgi:two-component system, LytTR family, response regulator LytT